MGNVLNYCLVQQETSIRVMRPDGDVMEFDRTLVAKQLMKTYPGHVVVHCSQVSRTSGLGERSKVSMLEAGDTLQLGQTYCLLRVPSQRRRVTPGMTNRNSNGDLDAPQIDQQLLYRAPTMADLQQQQFGGPWRPHLAAIIESPLHPRGHSLTLSPLARQARYSPLRVGSSNHSLAS